MKEVDLSVIIVVALLVGGFFTFIGGIIKHFDCGDILNFFDEEKQDKKKVSKKVGSGFLIMGLSIIGVSLISIFIDPKYYNFIMIVQVAITLIGTIVTTYIFFSRCKKDK